MKFAALVLVLASSITSCGHSQPPPQPSVNVANCRQVFCPVGFHPNPSDCQCVKDH